ncbi:hypothetical protein MKX03_022457 [Papaver bracteatum]|nr:hypothetical protein MKX03_022457 [Papaver bracteatum]
MGWKLIEVLLPCFVKTQIISSGILWGIGDIAAQRITHSRRIKVEVEPHQKTHMMTMRMKNSRSIGKEQLSQDDDDEDEKFKVNWKRAALTSGFGFGFVGPIGHYCTDFQQTQARYHEAGSTRKVFTNRASP